MAEDLSNRIEALMRTRTERVTHGLQPRISSPQTAVVPRLPVSAGPTTESKPQVDVANKRGVDSVDVPHKRSLSHRIIYTLLTMDACFGVSYAIPPLVAPYTAQFVKSQIPLGLGDFIPNFAPADSPGQQAREAAKHLTEGMLLPIKTAGDIL